MKKIAIACMFAIIFSLSAEESLFQPALWKTTKPAVFENGTLRLQPQSLAVYGKEVTETGLTVDVSLQPHDCPVPGTEDRYHSTGIRIVNGKDYWALQLVQRPGKGGRYLELRLFQNNKWQYDIGRTEQVLREKTEGCWNFEQKLRLVLKLTPTGVRGTLLDTATRRSLAQIEYRFRDDSLLRSGTPALWNGGLAADFSEFRCNVK